MHGEHLLERKCLCTSHICPSGRMRSDKTIKIGEVRNALAEPNGKDQLAYFWSKAMDAKKVQDDADVLAKAHAAMEVAKQRGYQLSSGQ